MQRKGLGYKRKLDYNTIQLFVKYNADTNLSIINAEFSTSKGHAGLILKKWAFSCKKKHLPTWKQRKQMMTSVFYIKKNYT